MARPRDVSAAIGIFVGVLLALQVFLLSGGRRAGHAPDTRRAGSPPPPTGGTAAALSVVLGVGSAAFYRYLR
jgi:hypothetical protein